ncbi:MAG TPA: L-seryl-tRNA(Sec) selenium transferase [Anaerolineae bacterium]|nr:L-seryl-tRNA(Sec) selenium transferase [Anaerolineae bacterium]HPL28163.1 L-seryl-tRNA(Sec) selenium transferase [Anaerolineae bacterium]
MPDLQAELRRLPSVDALLGHPELLALEAESGREPALAAVREVLDEARRAVRSGAAAPDHPALVAAAAERIRAWLQPSLRPVINASGVILQTNLGRAPLSAAALAAMARVAAYSNLEYDLEAGRRGSRYVHAEGVLQRVTGAEAALLTNNNAGAILLALSALAAGREVVISRGQLVEIGGGFRIPDVLLQSGARLMEVGTTNRTYARDFEVACGAETALLLQVHTSNFRVSGFVHQPTTAELAKVAHARGLPLVVDLGSGVLLDTAAFGMAHEPTVQECLQAGADLVTFSGDKLLGGPQAGIIVGRAELVAALRRHPLTRALRVDKLTIAALGATLAAYQAGRAVQEVPIWRMIGAPAAEVRRRARRWVRRLRALGATAEVVRGVSTVGGGSLPGETLPTSLAALRVASPDALARRLRLGDPAVIGRIEEERLLLDPRTVLPEQEADLLHALERALA